MPGVADRIERLAARAAADLERFEAPADPPDPERALGYLREGFGEAVMCYVYARTGEWIRFEPGEFERLETAMNTWLELYAACYGVEIEADASIRTAAELLLETHDIGDVAQLLTHVPARTAAGPSYPRADGGHSLAG